ncbi:MAG: hypothetical protein Q7S36_02175 [Candidatus Liptonbacteria bacterium]|nr:hypothetical protein [Candidatus Liptonbacteria bacterium]
MSERLTVERLTPIRESILKEMEGMIAAGHWTGPQTVLPLCFLPEHMRHAKPADLNPRPSPDEVAHVLNELIEEKKLRFSMPRPLQAIDGEIQVWLVVP